MPSGGLSERAETRVKFAIVGAGPTGLGAAWRLSERYPVNGTATEDSDRLPYLLLDESTIAGGRAASVTTPEGFTFDYGGHVLYPHPECREFIELVEKVVLDWHASVPMRGVWINGRLIPTPVQRNIHKLPASTLAACLWGLWRRPPGVGAAGNGATDEPNLRHYLEEQFGKPLTRHVMGPLNEKMWAYPLDTIGSGWSSHRSGSKERNIAEVKISSILRNLVLRQDEPGWSEATTVRYPLSGGMGQIWGCIFELIPQQFHRQGIRILSVDTSAKRLCLNDGSSVEYEHLISCMPIDLLLKLISDQPRLQARWPEFRAAKVEIFGFGLRGPMPDFMRGLHALNISSPAIPFWRVNLPGNFSPGNVPQTSGAWSILCESSLPPASMQTSQKDRPKEQRKAEIESVLRQLGFIPVETKVVSEFSAAFEHGYPVPFLGRDQLLNEVQASIEQLDIYSRGRFGGWRYEVSNQDHAFMQGVQVIDRLLNGTAETIYCKTW